MTQRRSPKGEALALHMIEIDARGTDEPGIRIFFLLLASCTGKSLDFRILRFWNF